MLKRAAKYLLVAVANLILLLILLHLWTDPLELFLNRYTRFSEYAKIFGLTVVTLIAISFAIVFFRKNHIQDRKRKIQYIILITILISGYKYIEYTSKIYQNRISNSKFRNQLASKINFIRNNRPGIEASHLSNSEYEEIARLAGFRKIPGEASDISFRWDPEDFLPDYLFELNYFLPVEMDVDSFDFRDMNFSKSQSFHIENEKKLVNYTEIRK